MNLGGDESPRQVQTGRVVETGTVLGGAGLHVVMPRADAMTDEPAAVTHEGDGYLPFAALVQGRRAHAAVAEQHHLGGVHEPGLGHPLPVFLDDQQAAVLAHVTGR